MPNVGCHKEFHLEVTLEENLIHGTNNKQLPISREFFFQNRVSNNRVLKSNIKPAGKVINDFWNQSTNQSHPHRYCMCCVLWGNNNLANIQRLKWDLGSDVYDYPKQIWWSYRASSAFSLCYHAPNQIRSLHYTVNNTFVSWPAQLGNILTNFLNERNTYDESLWCKTE